MAVKFDPFCVTSSVALRVHDTRSWPLLMSSVYCQVPLIFSGAVAWSPPQAGTNNSRAISSRLMRGCESRWRSSHTRNTRLANPRTPGKVPASAIHAADAYRGPNSADLHLVLLAVVHWALRGPTRTKVCSFCRQAGQRALRARQPAADRGRDGEADTILLMPLETSAMKQGRRGDTTHDGAIVDRQRSGQ